MEKDFCFAELLVTQLIIKNKTDFSLNTDFGFLRIEFYCYLFRIGANN